MEILKYDFYPSKILKTGVLQKKKSIEKTKSFPRTYVKKKIKIKIFFFCIIFCKHLF